MNRPTNVALLLASFVLMSACGRETSPEMPAGEPEASMPPAPTETNPDSGVVDPESTRGGMNTNRPDSSEDIAPGSDSGINPGTAPR